MNTLIITSNSKLAYRHAKVGGYQSVYEFDDGRSKQSGGGSYGDADQPRVAGVYERSSVERQRCARGGPTGLDRGE